MVAVEMVTRCRPLKRSLCNDSITGVVVVVLALLLVQFITGGHAKGASDDENSAAKLPQCAKVTCTQPPEGLQCNKTEIKNPAVLKKVGKMKECCTAWRCKEEDGSFSTYFGMSGTESAVKKDDKKDKKKDKKSKSAVTTTEKEDEAEATTPKPKKASKGKKPAKNAATTEKPDEDGEESTTPKSKATKKPKKKPSAVTVAPEEEKSPEDKCAEAKAKCPMPEGDDACTVTMSKESLNFKPKGELDSCCPIYNCTRPDGSYRLHYLMSGGTQPKKEDEVASEKGEGTDDKKCPNVQCATEPQAGSDGPICEKSTETESSRIKKLGPFRECCDIWKCVYPDTSFYTHFELQAPSFWLAETSFQSEPSTSTVVNAGIEEPTTTEETSTEKPGNVSGDEVAEPDEAAEEGGDAPAKKKKKKKPKHPHKPQPAPAPNGNGRYAYSTYYNTSWSSGDNPGGQNPNAGANNPSPPQMPSYPMGPPPGTIPMGPPPGVPMGPPPGTVPGMGYGPPMMMPQQPMMMPPMMFQGRRR